MTVSLTNWGQYFQNEDATATMLESIRWPGLSAKKPAWAWTK